MEIIKCNESQYRAREEINSSRLALAFKSIRHFNENIGPEPSDAMKLGTALHYAALEPGKFKELYVVEPDEIEAPVRIKKGSKTVESDQTALQPVNKKIPKHREILAQWRAEQESKGSIIITPDQMSSLTGMLASITEEMQRETKNPKALKNLVGSHSQYEVAAISKYRDFPIKGRADIITDHDGKRIGVDLKKTVSAFQDDFARKVFNLHYDLQAAFYKHLFELDEYYWLVVEEKPTSNGKHPLAIYDAAQYLPIGQKKMDQLFDKVERGGNHWYSDGAEELIPPSYQAAMYGEMII